MTSETEKIEQTEGLTDRQYKMYTEALKIIYNLSAEINIPPDELIITMYKNQIRADVECELADHNCCQMKRGDA
jgi:hypothetical protein